jgi:hypothetical protein
LFSSSLRPPASYPKNQEKKTNYYKQTQKENTIAIVVVILTRNKNPSTPKKVVGQTTPWGVSRHRVKRGRGDWWANWEVTKKEEEEEQKPINTQKSCWTGNTLRCEQTQIEERKRRLVSKLRKKKKKRNKNPSTPKKVVGQTTPWGVSRRRLKRGRGD